MNNEKSITLTIEQQALLSIVHEGKRNAEIGVVMIVGGPQYRIGSHRQFIQLARFLAKNGITTMRFDYRGMGDSEGTKQEFDAIDDDIKVAIDGLQKHYPSIKNVILWGLCDAASAALIYGYKDPRVISMVLLNPWLKNNKAEGQTMVKSYYIKRLLSKDFWKKIISGQVNVRRSVLEVNTHLKNSLTDTHTIEQSYQQRMTEGVNFFRGDICLILSGDDLTAKEFEAFALNDKSWKSKLTKSFDIHRLPMADHTFSSLTFKREVELITYGFVKGHTTDNVE